MDGRKRCKKAKKASVDEKLLYFQKIENGGFRKRIGVHILFFIAGIRLCRLPIQNQVYFPHDTFNFSWCFCVHVSFSHKIVMRIIY